MTKTKSNGRRFEIEFNKDGGHGLHQDAPDEFISSYFQDNYYDLFAHTSELISINRKLGKKRVPINECSNGYLEGDDRIYNIISLFGPRGAGKTSVMMSAVNALIKGCNDGDQGLKKFISEYEEIVKIDDSKISENLENVRFLSLGWIDASMLEDGDIFDVIISKMYSSFIGKHGPQLNDKWEDSTVTKSEILRLFASSYNYYHALKNGRKSSSSRELFSVKALEDVTSSLNVRKSIEELIDKFLTVMVKECTSDKYLVICIDDLDLSEYSFDILEDLHRYFMNRGVIIYVNADRDQLMRICDIHFNKYKVQPIEQAETKLEKPGESNVRNLTIRYIDKVLPPSKRIYLSTLLSHNLAVRPDYVSVKKTMLWKIARRTHVFFDGCGFKKHFYEPDNLRTMLNLNYTFSSMPKLYETETKRGKTVENRVNETVFMNRIQRNTPILLDDIQNRLLSEKLYSGFPEYELFNQMMKQAIGRRGAHFVKWVENNREDIFEGNADAIRMLESYKKNGYSYGEFLRCLNTVSSASLDYKPLIHVILAHFTVTLTELYHQLWFESKELRELQIEAASADAQLKRKQAEEMKDKQALVEQLWTEWDEIIGDSIIGSWANSMIRPIKKHQNFLNESIYVESLERLNVPIFSIDVPDNETADEYSEHLVRFSGLSNEKNHQKWKEIIRSLELLGLCFQNVSYQSRSCQSFVVNEKIVEKSLGSAPRQYKAPNQSNSSTSQESVNDEQKDEPKAPITENISSGGGSRSLAIKLNIESGTFDMFGFVVNCREIEDIKAVNSQIAEMFIQFGLELFKNAFDNQKQQKLRETVQNMSIAAEHADWKCEYLFALPIHCFDMMYNIFKRVIKKNNKEFKYNLEAKDVLNCYITCLDKIEEELANETEFYTEGVNENYVKKLEADFAKPFRTHPFVATFKELRNSKELLSIFEKFFTHLVNVAN